MCLFNRSQFHFENLIAITALFLFAALLPLGCGGDSGTQTDGGGKAKPERFFAKIGTGGKTGVYYPTGGAIKKMVEKNQAQNGVFLSVESTAGSVFNTNALLQGDLEFGIVSADVQYQAWNGMGEWSDQGPQHDLRFMLSFYSEAVTLVAMDDSGINSLEDVKGKHINIGNPGSGTRVAALIALEAAGIDPEKDIMAESVKPDDAAELMRDGKIDAFFYVVGHPNGSVLQATAIANRPVHFVPISHIEAIAAKYPYYSPTKILIQHYPGATNEEDVPTFGVKATMLTRKDVPDDVVYAMTREIFERLDAFKVLHPAYQELTPQNMLLGQTAEIHPGAERYYKEAGLMDADED
ncbi:TAXI family TRAP transporter solute-binding subunit [Candidatus Sumerlaeota bacterium]|nr:TAXI family TRAP transporter solute-binding subunit [Candidatus Sumerlaeota bacterium]